MPNTEEIEIEIEEYSRNLNEASRISPAQGNATR